MQLGITKDEQKIIIEILKEYPNYSFYYYGSRVKGTFNKTSDLDILIKGEKEMSLAELSELKEKFDESRLPYIVNFSDFHSINDVFYKLIEKDLTSVNDLKI